MSPQSILAHVTKLESLVSRHVEHPGNAAAQVYIQGCLASYGYAVERSICSYQGKGYVSPWAFKSAGSAELSMKPFAQRPAAPGPVFLVTAHFDSISMDAQDKLLDQAPGADDNASGVAVLLELARELAQRDLSYSVGFVFFNVEETGQQGSKEFAKAWKAQDRTLDGVINIDTIGTWPKPLGQGGTLNFVSNEPSKPFLERIRRSLSLPLNAAPTPWEDDHASFWAQGYAAIELTEEGCTAAMHSPQDTVEKLDASSMAKAAQALLEMFLKPDF